MAPGEVPDFLHFARKAVVSETTHLKASVASVAFVAFPVKAGWCDDIDDGTGIDGFRVAELYMG